MTSETLSLSVNSRPTSTVPLTVPSPFLIVQERSFDLSFEFNPRGTQNGGGLVDTGTVGVRFVIVEGWWAPELVDVEEGKGWILCNQHP